MQFNKTLKALLRAKQEGQNDSYKAGFNDALALLDQEERHIEFEKQTNFSEEVPQHFHVVKDSDKNIEGYQHQEEVNLDEKFEKVAKEAINELATFKEEINNTFSSDYATSPKLKTEPEDFSLFDEDIQEATHLSLEENLPQSMSQMEGAYGKGVLVTPLGKNLMKEQPLNEDKEIAEDVSEEDEKDASKDKHNNVGVDEQLDDEEIKKQRQLAALASARRKAQEEDDEDEDE